MKMNLGIPFDKVNRKHQYMSKEVILDALRKKGFLDSNIVINEETKMIYVFIDVTDIKEGSIVEFKAFEEENDDNDDLFTAAPPNKS